MLYTPEYLYSLQTISLLGSDIVIFKGLPNSDKTAQFVPSQEVAINRKIESLGIEDTHEQAYSVRGQYKLIETVYRRKHK